MIDYTKLCKICICCFHTSSEVVSNLRWIKTGEKKKSLWYPTLKKWRIDAYNPRLIFQALRKKELSCADVMHGQEGEGSRPFRESWKQKWDQNQFCAQLEFSCSHLSPRHLWINRITQQHFFTKYVPQVSFSQPRSQCTQLRTDRCQVCLWGALSMGDVFFTLLVFCQWNPNSRSSQALQGLLYNDSGMAVRICGKKEV